MKIEKESSGGNNLYKITNGIISIEILELDGRLLQISHLRKKYKFLSERIFTLAARSKFPYGITTWVKTGRIRDGAAGVLSENAIGYDVPVSEPVKIEEKSNKFKVLCVIEKNALKLEKIYEIEKNVPWFTYTTRLINQGERRNLQLEHFFVWNSDHHRESTCFVVPRENGLDQIFFPAFEELDCHAIKPSEQWAAFLDCDQKSSVIFTFSGIHCIARYIAGDNGQCAGYSPEIILEKNAEIVNTYHFYIFPNVKKQIEKCREVEPIRKNLMFLCAKKDYISITQSVEDTIENMLCVPEKFVRNPGQFNFKSDVSIEATGLEKEAELFIRQIEFEYGIKLNKKSEKKKIKLIAQEQKDSQAYRLRVNPENICITGTPESIQYGLETLLALCTKTGNDVITPCCEIEDKPEVKIRGMLMFPSGKRWDVLLKKFAIGVLTQLRFNAFMIYLSPDSFVPSQPIKNIKPVPTAIEEKDLRNLVTEMQSMHIKVLVCCSTKHVLCPQCQKEDAEIMCEFLKRIHDIVKPDFINIGYDEMGRFNAGCQCSPDIKNHHAFVKSVSYFHNFLKMLGTRASIWCDMLVRKPGDPLGWLDDPEWAIESLPKDIILNDYEYMPDVVEYPRIERWKNKGFDVVCTPWAMEENILHWVESAKKYHADGIIGSSWAEGPSEKKLGYIEGLIWTGLLSWRSTNVDIYKKSPIVKRFAKKIAERKWEKYE
ncbi:MAG TPA: glycoside hydrolase family 20 zincin-like fold domain-containing protein [bacterium]|nr:glycoside hydrolase family 20 zincin-like fold domain-containing protein [bacterium]HOL36013.1 glycoside hydrolase family 20 zincin-like fold domain-containing protein [bacterium]HPP09251.1 glycoside hydrolase family 20 zincin-like fold domain-containing protein [bacterium]